jgi:hypothetical protein
MTTKIDELVGQAADLLRDQQALTDEGAVAMLERLVRDAYAAGQELAAAQAAYDEMLTAQAATEMRSEPERSYQLAQEVLERLVREAYAAGQVLPQLRAAVRAYRGMREPQSGRSSRARRDRDH